MIAKAKSTRIRWSDTEIAAVNMALKEISSALPDIEPTMLFKLAQELASRRGKLEEDRFHEFANYRRIKWFKGFRSRKAAKSKKTMDTQSKAPRVRWTNIERAAVLAAAKEVLRTNPKVNKTKFLNEAQKFAVHSGNLDRSRMHNNLYSIHRFKWLFQESGYDTVSENMTNIEPDATTMASEEHDINSKLMQAISSVLGPNFPFSPFKSVIREDVSQPIDGPSLQSIQRSVQQLSAMVHNAENGSNWETITESEFPWEQSALDFIKQHLPQHEPYKAWSNFSFIACDGSINEVDLLVFSPTGVYLIEIKSQPGILSGDNNTWLWEYGTKKVTSKNPLILANNKAKKLRAMLAKQPEARNFILPFIEPLVFCSAEELKITLNNNAESRVCTRDSGNTPGIINAIMKRRCPGLDPICRGDHSIRMSNRFAAAMSQSGIYSESVTPVHDYQEIDRLDAVEKAVSSIRGQINSLQDMIESTFNSGRNGRRRQFNHSY